MCYLSLIIIFFILGQMFVKKYKCSYCERAYANKGNLNRHVEEIHNKGNPKKFECHICHKSFRRKDYISFHIETVHGVFHHNL